MQDVFANQLAAEIGQHQQAETGQGPADRFVPAPAKAVAAPQQHAEHHPRQARQQGFMHQVLGEQVFDEQPAHKKLNSRLSMVCSGGKFLIRPDGCLCLSWWSCTSRSNAWNTAMVNMP